MAKAIDYPAAAYPETWRVLGVQLLPFSLGHYFKLRRLGCAFIDDETKNASLGDLLVGIICCSMRSDPDMSLDPFWQWLNNTKCGSRLRLRNLLFRPPMMPAEWDVYRWGKRVGAKHLDFAEKVKLFADYIRENSEPPGFQPRDEDRDLPSGAHWSHSIVHALTSKCGYTLEQAYNTQVKKAICDWYKHAETEGAGRITTAEEEAIFG